jgi:hypothetical protein
MLVEVLHVLEHRAADSHKSKLHLPIRFNLWIEALALLGTYLPIGYRLALQVAVRRPCLTDMLDVKPLGDRYVNLGVARATAAELLAGACR